MVNIGLPQSGFFPATHAVVWFLFLNQNMHVDITQVLQYQLFVHDSRFGRSTLKFETQPQSWIFLVCKHEVMKYHRTIASASDSFVARICPKCVQVLPCLACNWLTVDRRRCVFCSFLHLGWVGMLTFMYMCTCTWRYTRFCLNTNWKIYIVWGGFKAICG